MHLYFLRKILQITFIIYTFVELYYPFILWHNKNKLNLL